MARKGGYKRSKRYLLSKNYKKKGKITIGDYLKQFENGDRVNLQIEPAVTKGQYMPKYIGKAGIIVGKQGECYMVQIKDLNKVKNLIVHPVHLKLK